MVVLADPDSPLLRTVDAAMRSVGAVDVRFASSAADLIRRLPAPTHVARCFAMACGRPSTT